MAAARRRPRLTGLATTDAAVDLYWLPLGAGGHSVRFNGLIFEAISAWARHRPRRDLYHSALEVTLAADRYTIEMAPVWNDRSPCRGVVAEGAVGARRLGRLRAFRYEIRCWRDGRIPDIDEAVDSPRRLTGDAECARRILGLAPQVPTAVWGRDELHTGDMWNSNSVISWRLRARKSTSITSIHRCTVALLDDRRTRCRTARRRSKITCDARELAAVRTAHATLEFSASRTGGSRDCYGCGVSPTLCTCSSVK